MLAAQRVNLAGETLVLGEPLRRQLAGGRRGLGRRDQLIVCGALGLLAALAQPGGLGARALGITARSGEL